METLLVASVLLICVSLGRGMEMDTMKIKVDVTVDSEIEVKVEERVKLEADSVQVEVDLTQVHATVEPEFLSVTIDSNIFSPPHWRSFRFSSPRVQTLLKGLSPAYLRLGGTAADHVVFSNEPVEVFEKCGITPPMHVYNSTDIDDLADLMRTVNYKLLFDLNLQLRYGTQWDPTNTASLLGYINKMKYHDVFNFELGNEPDLFRGVGILPLNGTRIGKDFVILHNLLQLYNFKNVTFVGPDNALVSNKRSIEIYSDFLNEAGPYMTAATFHHYYFNGRSAPVSEYTDAAQFDKYVKAVRQAKSLVRQSKTPDLPVWLGEAADAYGGGTRNVSDRYVSGFLWLDKLGISAREGMGVVMRQTFFGGSYGLMNKNDDPNPDYWLSHLHKTLVGQKVLNVSTSSQKWKWKWTLKGFWQNLQECFGREAPKEVRIYAHCTPVSSKYKAGSVTVFGLSVKKSGSVTLTFPAPLSSQTVHVYLLTPVGPEGLTSKQVALNGETLKMVDDQTLPELVPVKQSASRGIQLAALTFGFFVFPDADASACK